MLDNEAPQFLMVSHYIGPYGINVGKSEGKFLSRAALRGGSGHYLTIQQALRSMRIMGFLRKLFIILDGKARNPHHFSYQVIMACGRRPPNTPEVANKKKWDFRAM